MASNRNLSYSGETPPSNADSENIVKSDWKTNLEHTNILAFMDE